MKYFLIVQSDIDDQDPTLSGPFSSINKAKKASDEYNPDAGWIFTILAQTGNKLTQIEQAIFTPNLSWKRTR